MNKRVTPSILCTLIFISTSASAIFVNTVNLEISNLNDEDSWALTFGGPDFEWGYDVKQVDDGGYVVVGATVSYAISYSDVYLLKVDKYGNEIWGRTYDGGESKPEIGFSFQQTEDGGYIITGESHTQGKEDNDLILIKTDENGKEIWYKKFGVGDHIYIGNEVKQTNDGGYIVTGQATYFENHTGRQLLLLLKTDENGNIEWEKRIGGGYDSGESVLQTEDGGYIITGVTWTYTGEDDFCNLWLLKTDLNGNEEWNKSFGGYDQDFGRCIRQTVDGGYIITGGTHSYGEGGSDVWLLKTDLNGNEEWNKTFGGYDHDSAYCVTLTNDGGYILAGATKSGGEGNYDFYIVKTDENGNKIWKDIIGGDLGDVAYSIDTTSYGGYILTGYTHSYGAGGYDIWLIKIEDVLSYKPETPIGETNGRVGDTYTYSTSAQHPNNKKIKYGWDWHGNGIVDYWTEYVESGEMIYTDNTWMEQGAYLVKVKAKDEDGCVSEWSDPLEVIIPKNLLVHNLKFKTIFFKFFEIFQLTKKIFNNLKNL